MSNKGYSKDDGNGYVDHYDENGRYVGYSKKDKYGYVDHYNVDGTYNGYSKKDGYGYTDHYNSDGTRNGYSKTDKYGYTDHYNNNGTYEGYSKTDKYGYTDHYGENNYSASTYSDPYASTYSPVYSAPSAPPKPKGEYKSHTTKTVGIKDYDKLNTAENMSSDDVRAYARCVADMLTSKGIACDFTHKLTKKAKKRYGFLFFFRSEVDNYHVYANEKFWMLESVCHNQENPSTAIREQDEYHYVVLRPDGEILKGNVVENYYNITNYYNPYAKSYEKTCDYWEAATPNKTHAMLIDALLKRHNINFSSGQFMNDFMLVSRWKSKKLPAYEPEKPVETRLGYFISSSKVTASEKKNDYISAGIMTAIVCALMTYVTGFNSYITAFLLLTAAAFALTSIPKIRAYCDSCNIISRIYLAAASIPLALWISKLHQVPDYRCYFALGTVVVYTIIQYLLCRKISVMDTDKSSVKAYLNNVILRKRLQKIALAIQLVTGLYFAYLKLLWSPKFEYVYRHIRIGADGRIERQYSILTICYIAVIVVSAGLALLLSLLIKRSKLNVRLSDNNLALLFYLILVGTAFASDFFNVAVPVIAFQLMWVVFGFIYHRRSQNIYGTVLVLNEYAILASIGKTLVYSIYLVDTLMQTNRAQRFGYLLDIGHKYIHMLLCPGIGLANKITPLIDHTTDKVPQSSMSFIAMHVLGSPILPVVVMMCLTLAGALLKELVFKLDLKSLISTKKKAAVAANTPE